MPTDSQFLDGTSDIQRLAILRAAEAQGTYVSPLSDNCFKDATEDMQRLEILRAIEGISGGGGGTVTNIETGTGLSGGPITTTGTIDLDKATTTTLGGIIVGDNLTIDGNGKLDASIPTNPQGKAWDAAEYYNQGFIVSYLGTTWISLTNGNVNHTPVDGGGYWALPSIANTQVTGLGTASTKDVAVTGDASTTQVVLGNDTRLTDSRTPTGAATGDLSGNYPNPTVDGLQGRPVSSNAPSSGQVLQFDGTNWTPGQIPSGGSGGGGLVYFLNFGNSTGISPTTGLPTSPVAPSQLGRNYDIGSGSITSNPLTNGSYSLVCGFVTISSEPNITDIPAGLWDFNIWADVSSSSGNQTQFQVRVYKYRSSNSTYTLIASSDDVFVYDPATTAQYIANVTMPQTTILSTDRIYIELWAQKNVSGARTISFYFDSAHPSHCHTTLPSVSGTGIVKVINGVLQSPATLIVDADVSATAAIAQSKLNLTNAAADGATKGIAAFTASDFDATAGVVSIDYTNGQAASASTKGFLTAANWTTFNNKQATITTGSVDNAILRADGTGGATLQNSDLNIDDATVSTQANVAITNQHAGQTNSSLVLTPKGTGAFILGPKPDGTTTGGNARGTNAVDLQTSRTNAAQVASGANSFVGGVNCISSGSQSFAFGFNATSSGSQSFASGINATSSGSQSFASGINATSSGNQTFAFGNSVNASQFNSSVFGGYNNTANANLSCVAGGAGNLSSGVASFTAGGNNTTTVIGNTASAQSSSCLGGQGALADRFGMYSNASGRFAANGDAQRGRFTLRCKTTTNTGVEMALDGSTTYLGIPSGKVMSMTINISGVKSDGTAVAHYVRQYSVKNVSGTSSQVYAPVTIGSDNPAGTTIALSVNDPDDTLRILVTGIVSETWRWVASVDAVEIAYGT